MKTVCVAGSMSNSGKTTFSSLLLSRLVGWSACKVTTCVERKGEPCPRGSGVACGVCGGLESPYEIEEEHGGTENRAKDTGRLKAAGARRVLWVRSRPECLAEAVHRALEMLEGSVGVLLEGNHVLTVLDPDLSVMILSEDGRMKRSAQEVRDKVDLFARGARDAWALGKALRAVNLDRGTGPLYCRFL